MNVWMNQQLNWLTNQVFWLDFEKNKFQSISSIVIISNRSFRYFYTRLSESIFVIKSPTNTKKWKFTFIILNSNIRNYEQDYINIHKNSN
jgi:hypothetical protein